MIEKLCVNGFTPKQQPRFQIHTGNHTYDVSLAREFQKHPYNAEFKQGVIDQV